MAIISTIINLGEITLFGKKKTENQEIEEKKRTNSNDSAIVTKESFCSTCAVFSLLAFIILCTKTLIFGELGKSIHIFLTGAFGYLAYPVIFGALYLSIMGLFGKRLVRNRKVGACIAFAFIFLFLMIHTIVTYSWEADGYLKACFASGETFPNTVPAGYIGGAAILGLSSLITKLGTAITFGVLAVLCVYLCYVQLKKKKVVASKAEDTLLEEQPQSTHVHEELPTHTEQPTYAQQPVYGGQVPYVEQTPMYNLPTEMLQRPGVSLDDGTGNTHPTGQGFSPFGIPSEQNQSADEPITLKNLFDISPAEQYKRNLLFDPTAKVNQRKGTEVPPQSVVQHGYTPSYTQTYERDLNTPQSRPAKVVSDRSNSSYPNYYGENTPSQAPIQTPTWNTPVEKSSERMENSTPRYEEPQAPTSRYSEPYEPASRYEEATSPTPTSISHDEEPHEEPSTKRHEYMELFSSENPNLYGNDPESARLAQEFADRALARSQERKHLEEENQRREGMNLFDDSDSDDDLYTLRSERDIPRTSRDSYEDSLRGQERFDEERGRDFDENTRLSRYDEELNDDFSENSRNRGFGAERGFEELARERGLEGEAEETHIRGFDIDRVEETRSRSYEAESVTETPKPIKPPRVIRPYNRPSLDEFDCRDIEPMASEEEVNRIKENIISTLEDFNVKGATIASVTFGPTVTRYNIAIPRNILPKKVVSLSESIAFGLYSSGVSVYPNYDDGVVSVEVPNKVRQFVHLGSMLTGDTYVNAKSPSLAFVMGKDVANRRVYGDVDKMVHMLVAGATKAGKSVFLGTLIISLIYKYSPEELRLILIDPKKTEFVLYNNLPHLMINEIITDAGKAVQSLNWAIGEMNRRYALFEKMSLSGKYVVTMEQYNEYVEKADRLPKIVIIIDELADLMLAAKKEIEDRIQNLAQKARAAGLHLIVATQRPSADVITGVIKSNLTTRIAFAVASEVDSRVILDQTGAHKLLGKGDLLYTMPGINHPVRVQSAFISPEESQRVVDYIKQNNEAYYDEEASAYINSRGGNGGDSNESGGEVDPMYIEALRHVILSNSASISMIQRKCSTGYNRAGKIVEWMEDMGYISPFDGAKARKVLITKEEFEQKYGQL